MKSVDSVYFKALYALFWRIASRHDGAFETVLDGFLQAFFTIGYRANLARQANFTKHHKIAG